MKIKYIACLLVASVFFASCEKDNGEISSQPVAYSNFQKKSLKRGVSFNFSTLPQQDCALLGPACSWSYNWSGNIPASNVEAEFQKYGMEFVQMIWNGNYNADNFRNYRKSHPDAEYILAFNEPNLTDQANMTPEQAAALWPQVKALASELGMKLISPAMNYGTLSGYSDPYKWLDEFFDQPEVSLDDIAGIAVHCYMGSADAVKNYIDGFKKYGKPIWLTEFCAWDNNNISADTQMKYMVETINYLETEPDVFRYAWFIPRGNGEKECHNSLLTGPSGFGNTDVALTDLGKVFVDMSTFDKSLFYGVGEPIPAEHYTAVSGKVHLRPSTDKGGLLELYDLTSGNWVEYQVNIPYDGAYWLDMRFSSYRDGEIIISTESDTTLPVTVPNTSREWMTMSTELSLKAGKQTIRITGNSAASPSINWIRLN